MFRIAQRSLYVVAFTLLATPSFGQDDPDDPYGPDYPNDEPQVEFTCVDEAYDTTGVEWCYIAENCCGNYEQLVWAAPNLSPGDCNDPAYPGCFPVFSTRSAEDITIARSPQANHDPQKRMFVSGKTKFEIMNRQIVSLKIEGNPTVELVTIKMPSGTAVHVGQEIECQAGEEPTASCAVSSERGIPKTELNAQPFFLMLSQQSLIAMRLAPSDKVETLASR